MGGIFHPDSKLMRLLTFVTNLVCLNLLWIVSCIPIITAGAATTAMYSVLFSYLTQKEDAVLKPFLRAFRDNFRRVTPAWLLHMLVAAVLIAGVFYMTLGVPILVKVIFGLALFFYAAASSYCYPLFARFKGGKAVATMYGFLFGLILCGHSVWIFLVPLIVFMVVLWLSKIVSLSSMVSAVAATAFVWITTGSWRIGAALMVFTVLIIVRHRKNIAKMVRGEENRIKWM
jgi:acyl-phosphate glycerol 3-phosphate acyltransferase